MRESRSVRLQADLPWTAVVSAFRRTLGALSRHDRVGRQVDERVIREYIRKQEQEDARLEQLGLWR